MKKLIVLAFLFVMVPSLAFGAEACDSCHADFSCSECHTRVEAESEETSVEAPIKAQAEGEIDTQTPANDELEKMTSTQLGANGDLYIYVPEDISEAEINAKYGSLETWEGVEVITFTFVGPGTVIADNQFDEASVPTTETVQ